MIAYYVNNSIHQIPSFIYIARELGGIVFTNGPDSYKILRQEYSDVPVEYYQTIKEISLRMAGLQPQAVVQPDYTKHELALSFNTVHVQVFHGTSDKSYNLMRNLRDYDLVLLPGERSYNLMSKAGLLKPGRHAVVGYPKVDRIFQGKFNREEIIARMGFNPNYKTLLYAPTWRDSKFNTSLPRFGYKILTTIPDNYNLIVKLHPNTRIYDRKYYSLAQQLSAGKPHVKLLAFEHDIIPIMAGADLLLCDISAVSHEFLCFDRPLVFLDPRLLPLGKNKVWVWSAGAVVRNPNRLWQVVKEELSAPDRYSAQRKAARKSIFYQLDGHAAERSAAAIRAFLAQRNLC